MASVQRKPVAAAPSAPSAPAKLPTPPPSQSGPVLELKTAEANANYAAPKLSTSSEAQDAPTTPPFSPSSTTPVFKHDPELDFVGTVEVNNDLPTPKDLKRCEDLLVLDAKGQSRPFKELYTNIDGEAPRQLLIFIRHFFCGNCQEYLRELSASITPDSLFALDEPTFITVIGCGRPDLINMYTEATNCPFPIYADPTGKLYEYLGMTRTLDLGKKPSYIQSNLLVTSLQSIAQALKTGTNALKGGDFKQVGGEFLFEGGECVWVHRMRHTRDHTEIKEMREKLGLTESTPVPRKRWSHGVKPAREEIPRDRRSSWLGRARSTKSVKSSKSIRGTRTPEMLEEKDEDKSGEQPVVPGPRTYQ
ncbi:hypothetical protein P280DRAFT_466800 [Massarina eburnea CBS 473.64]|uniref:AhpC-TSA-domain-containing protein n=1 Tax=Massarina eburnea CBS 473.64 TaxID=1395130 RepID=A0A6A6S8D3_9PLEO|nr:hypothetical protein P280DRAFT_466800 [Massarina eburnea CBS 473.64]